MSDEIIVRGAPLSLPGSAIRPVRFVARAPAEGPGRGSEPGIAFVPPATPQVIEEIVTKAKRTTRTAQAVRGAGTRLSTAGIVAATFGFLTAKILEEISQQKLDEKFRELEAIRGRVKPDSPLEVQPQPQPQQVIPEIIVTARRRSALIDLVTGGVPLPLRVPGDPPRIPPGRRRRIREPRPPGRPRRPRRTREKPRRKQDPKRDPRRLPSRPPQEIPGGDPTRRETTVPRRDPRPTIRRGTGLQIGNLSDIQFADATAPQRSTINLPGAGSIFSFGVNPIFGNPLTGINVGRVTFEDVSPQQQAQQAAGTARRCQPCPKPKPKRRKKCHVKLVHERAFEKWDRVTKWREIDCLTGRPV